MMSRGHLLDILAAGGFVALEAGLARASLTLALIVGGCLLMTAAVVGYYATLSTRRPKRRLAHVPGPHPASAQRPDRAAS